MSGVTGRRAAFTLNRGLIVALVPIAIIDSFARRRLLTRRTWAAFFSLVLLAALAAKALDPLLYEDRVSNPDNVYQRIAQHQETLSVFREYPLFGVGFALYHDFALQNPQYMTRWKGIESMTVQHNVLMTVLTDEGIVGLVLYCSSQIFLILAMWRLRKSVSTRLAGLCLLRPYLPAHWAGLRNGVLLRHQSLLHLDNLHNLPSAVAN